MRKKEKSKIVHGELISLPSRSEPQRTLDAATQQIADRRRIGRLLMPHEQRKIARKLRAKRTAEIINLSVTRLIGEADARVLQVELESQQQRKQILAQQNTRLGALKRLEADLAADALRTEVIGENERQYSLSHSNCLEEDRQMLAALFKRRSHANIEQIAREHGLERNAASPSPSNEKSDPGEAVVD